MRNALRAGAIVLAPATVQAQAQALPLTVAEMQRACAIVSGDSERTEPEDAIAAGACYGAMRGVVQVMQANCRSFSVGQRPAPGLSAGEIPSAGDAIAAFDAWVDENPDQTDAPAEYGIIVALAQAYPCFPAIPQVAPSSGEREGSEDEGEGASEDGVD